MARRPADGYVMDKLHWDQTNIRIEDTRSFYHEYEVDSSHRWLDQYTLYKFEGDHEYRIKTISRFTDTVDDEQSLSKVKDFRCDLGDFKFNTHSLDKDFIANADLFEWLVVHYKCENENLRIINFADTEEGYILYDENGFFLISGSRKIQFTFMNKCFNVSSYEHSWFDEKLDPIFQAFTERLFSQIDQLDNFYNIIGSSENGLIYSDNLDLECLEDAENYEYSGNVYFINRDEYETISLNKGMNMEKVLGMMTDFLNSGKVGL